MEFILGLLARGATADEVLEEYDGLAPEDIQACMLFCDQNRSKARHFMPLTSQDRFECVSSWMNVRDPQWLAGWRGFRTTYSRFYDLVRGMDDERYPPQSLGGELDSYY